MPFTLLPAALIQGGLHYRRFVYTRFTMVDKRKKKRKQERGIATNELLRMYFVVNDVFLMGFLLCSTIELMKCYVYVNSRRFTTQSFGFFGVLLSRKGDTYIVYRCLIYTRAYLRFMTISVGIYWAWGKMARIVTQIASFIGLSDTK